MIDERRTISIFLAAIGVMGALFGLLGLGESLSGRDDMPQAMRSATVIVVSCILIKLAFPGDTSR